MRVLDSNLSQWGRRQTKPKNKGPKIKTLDIYIYMLQILWKKVIKTSIKLWVNK
jgi:hypothetical protein